MILQKLEIEREQWGEKKGQLTGKVRFSDGTGNAFELSLTPELNEKFMGVIGEALMDSAAILQSKLIAHLVDCSPSLRVIEAPPR